MPFWDGEAHLDCLCMHEYEYIIYARVATCKGPWNWNCRFGDMELTRDMDEFSLWELDGVKG